VDGTPRRHRERADYRRKGNRVRALQQKWRRPRTRARAASTKWLKEHNPSALDSKVELLFREKGWEIIWAPPYCPKFQMIVLVWGAGKQRAGTL
jgi:transposase